MIDAKNLDKYYTKSSIALECYNILKDYIINQNINIDDILFVEPSAGNGSFLNIIKENKIGFDISPDNSSIVKIDFLKDSIKNYINCNKKIIFIGNPPFGKNSSLALQFLNKSFEYSDIIGFILPRTFKKIGMQNKVNIDYSCIQEYDLPMNSFTFLDKAYKVPCVFQIWTKSKQRERIRKKIISNLFEFITKENADFAIRRVGGCVGKIFDEFNIYKASSNYFIKVKIQKDIFKQVIKNSFTELQRIAKNYAGNPSLSKTELIDIIESKLL